MTDSAKIWKHVLREGICAVEEVARALGMPPPLVKSRMNHLTNRGSLKRYPRPQGGTAMRYGVTADCTIPVGVTVKEVIE